MIYAVTRKYKYKNPDRDSHPPALRAPSARHHIKTRHFVPRFARNI